MKMKIQRKCFFEIPEFFLEKMHEYAVLTHNIFYMLAKNQK